MYVCDIELKHVLIYIANGEGGALTVRDIQLIIIKWKEDAGNQPTQKEGDSQGNTYTLPNFRLLHLLAIILADNIEGKSKGSVNNGNT